jgi:hypothetical protein
MRGFGLFFGSHKRNDPYRLEPRNPVERYYDSSTGNTGQDGYTVLSKADPDRAGSPPNVGGTPEHQGPDQSFEQ